MLDRGYLTGSGFYPSFAHKESHIVAFLQAMEPVFAELSQVIQKGDVLHQLQAMGVPVRHTGFARLT
jgi:glutamate-1-semialdehyde 2,1-aminomutase